MKQRILIVDDTRMCRTGMILGLTPLDLIADEAHCGEIAIKMVKQNSYDLVLIDPEMPGMSAFECTRLIRTNEIHSTRHTLIVGFSAASDLDNREECLRSGMDGFIASGATLDELLNDIRTWLKKAALNSRD